MFHFPTLPWITPDVVVTWKQGVLEDRHVFERIWTLLRQNPRLVVLDIPLQAGLRDLPESFIITTLSSMQHLKELRLTWHTLDTETFLTAIPRLERLCIFNLQGIISKQEDFGDLRYFYIQRSITVNELSAIVERLPKLEDLRISSVRDEDKKEPATVWTGKLFRLVKKLKLNVAHDFNDDTIALLVRLFPAVVSVHIPTVFEKTKEALWENCYDLDEIVSEEAVSTDAWRQRRLEDAEKQSKECKHDN
ncbi:hypothetical protein BGZ95_009310 [Linnemannia exigua]|uniref:Uncharacterized protein n=1 Tax=Linnemannia exigua TaxID=604196 RepID=A0AAD4DD17_9FUNG|nr:hypothetical protein BGZ95_009310 [Linnemannia exigua]